MIKVTQPFLPPLEEYTSYLEKIWENKWLTNGGPFHEQLEEELKKHLGVKHISLFSNGTLALITALQVLKIKGEVITTPYSFVATSHSLWWNNIKPLFVDIEPDFCNINPDKIEAAITPDTTAIMPVHVYGNPCNVKKIKEIADAYGLKIIYDACHAFDVKLDSESILNFGDLSVLSFHATKIFNTFEGGAIICHDEETKKRIDFLKNFGYNGELSVIGPGTNAKMNELQAAFGLLQLKYIDKIINRRKEITDLYKSLLFGIPGLSYINQPENVEYNYAYFPIFIDELLFGKERDFLNEELKKQGIVGRRYFYPLISNFSTYRGLPSAAPANLPIAEAIAQKVLCLPLYPDLKNEEVKMICSTIKTIGERK